MRATKEVVRQKIIAARDLIKCHPLTLELATELFTSKGMGVFRFSAALIEWSESEIPAKKWGDTEIAERGRSVLVMRARCRSAGWTPHQRGWTDAG